MVAHFCVSWACFTRTNESQHAKTVIARFGIEDTMTTTPIDELEEQAMASSEDYLEYVLDLLQDVPDTTHKKMMGEYLLYSDGVLFGGIYDDRFLLKDTPAARDAFPQEQVPYEGAKAMLLVDSEDPVRIAETIEAMIPQLPKPKKKR